MLDYPGQAACIFWFTGCNLRCRYCYNSSFASGKGEKRYTRDDAVNFLEDRVGFLDAVVFSGGECTLSSDLPDLAVEAKKRRYLVKVDTNGTRPKVLKYLIREGLVDYVALDYKAPSHLFGDVTGRPELYGNFSETLDYLIETGFPFEVRTTLHSDLLTEEDISLMNADLALRGYEGIHYIQHYFHTEDNLGHLQKPVRNFDSSLLAWNVPYEFRNSL